jgi:hypothetical protein
LRQAGPAGGAPRKGAEALHLTDPLRGGLGRIEEACGAEVLATCDDVLLRRAARVTASLRVLAVLDLFKEVVS